MNTQNRITFCRARWTFFKKPVITFACGCVICACLMNGGRNTMPHFNHAVDTEPGKQLRNRAPLTVWRAIKRQKAVHNRVIKNILRISYKPRLPDIRFPQWNTIVEGRFSLTEQWNNRRHQGMHSYTSFVFSKRDTVLAQCQQHKHMSRYFCADVKKERVRNWRSLQTILVD